MKQTLSHLVIWLCTLSIIFISINLSGQNYTQTIRGTVIDQDSHAPLVGTTVSIVGSEPLIGTTTDVEGRFRIEHIPIGRIELHFSFLGYEQKILPNILISSGKEEVLVVSLSESTIAMEEVLIKAFKTKGEPVNEMTLISANAISPEETTRYAGGFNDPSRIVTAFAGVSTGNDGDNEIIVRGNSPKYLQWRLEGMEITNPSHFGDQNAVRGGISALNNNLLATSDFSTGAFSAEYGNVLSAVYDVKLRAGNNEQFESTFGFGILGTDLTFEGPFKKGYGGSFLINYRYSTIGLIDQLGLVDIDGVLNFQDAAFKVLLPTQKLGVFSLFGIGGSSSFQVEDVQNDLLSTPGDQPSGDNIIEDYNKSADLFNIGLNHSISINESSYIKSFISYSSNKIDEDVYESTAVGVFDDSGVYLKDTFINRNLDYISDLKKSTLRASMTYNNKINARNTLQIGSRFNSTRFQYDQSWLQENTNNRFIASDFSENINTISNFINWKVKFKESVTLVAGIQNFNVLYNNKSTIEPRVAFDWKVGKSSSLNFGYGLHSQMESIHNYFSKVLDTNSGQIIEPNQDLDLLKAHHFVLGYKKNLGTNIRAKAEIYYQDLFNIPVANNPKSTYSTLNENTDFRYVDLINQGSGKNYGLELTIEQYFKNQFYFLINGTIFSSKYKTLENIERNTRYNGNYLVNVLFGKEFDRLGKKQNQTLSLNTKIFLGGGKHQLRLLRDNNGEASVDPINDTHWNESEAYETKLDDLYQITLSASYKFNKARATHEIFLTIDNVSNTKRRISEYYDSDETDKVGYIRQFGIFPNLMYRVYF